MNNRAVVLALLFALFAVFMVQSYVSSIEEETQKKFGTETLVVVAKKDIPEMESIDESMLELKRIPKKFLQPSAVYLAESDDDKAGIQSLKELAGSIAIVPIKEGNQVTFNVIREPNIRTGLAPEVAPGKRAVTISVTEVSGVGKLVKPGDRVDIVGIIDGGGGNEYKMAKTLLQDVAVLAVGRNVTNNVPRVVERATIGNATRVRNLAESDAFTSVTLEVSPMQAQALFLMLNNSEKGLYLSLRNADDSERVDLPGINMTDVLGPEASRVRAPAGGRR